MHESVTIDGTIGRITSPLHHYSYLDWEDRRNRIEGYATLWARQQFGAGRRAGPLAAPLRASWRFVRGLVLRNGWLDGRLGLRIALSNAEEVYRKYRQLQRLSKTASA